MAEQTSPPSPFHLGEKGWEDLGSHPSVSTVPSRRTTAGAVTTGRQNTASPPADGALPATVTVPP